MGIQEGAADWDEDWDKFEDEGTPHIDLELVDASSKILISILPDALPRRARENSLVLSIIYYFIN